MYRYYVIFSSPRPTDTPCVSLNPHVVYLYTAGEKIDGIYVGGGRENWRGVGIALSPHHQVHF